MIAYRQRPRHAVCMFLAALGSLAGAPAFAEEHLVELVGRILWRSDIGVWN